MPSSYNPGSGQDWDVANVGRSTLKTTAVPKTARAITQAKAAGTMVTEKRYGAGGNASAHSATIMSTKKLEESDDVVKIQKVDKELAKAIMQARMAKKLTQKDLATLINEKPQVVADYESSKAIPNPQIITKLEKQLGCKLPRPGKKPTPKASSTDSASNSVSQAKVASLTRGGPTKRR